VDRQALLSGLFAALAAAPLAPLLEREPPRDCAPGAGGEAGAGGREGAARDRGGAGQGARGGARAVEPLRPGDADGADGSSGWADEPTSVLLARAATALLVDQVPLLRTFPLR
jgi:hypothetical protein